MSLESRNFSIRRATLSDIPAIMSLVRRVVPLMRASGNLQWDDHYPNEHIFERDIDHGELWVAECNSGVIAAVVAITTDQSPEYADVGWDIHEPAIVVHRLAVDPDFRGAGLAHTLMEYAEIIARERGILILRVDTNTKNPATQGLLPKLGYKLAGEIDLAFRPGLRFFCYQKLLAPRFAAVALGSNLDSPYGDREANLHEAIRRISALGSIRAVSHFRETAPVGYINQPDFLNAALLLGTALEPLALMRALLGIERDMGRDRAMDSGPAKGPRIIDLDLLLVDDAILKIPELTLPHPAMTERRFVLEPLAEIAPAMIHPTSGHTIAELLAKVGVKQP